MHFEMTALRFSAAVAVGLWGVGCAENLTPPPDRDAYSAPGLQAAQCVPNLDGQITAEELGALTGVPVSYLISPSGTERSVDVGGETDAEGHRVWDWSVDMADDEVLTVAARTINDRWYAGEFPEAGLFAVPLDAAGTMEGIYRQDEQGLWLLGRASTLEEPPEGQTLIRYVAPVAAFRFPLVAPMNWVTVGEIEAGTLLGLPFAAKEIYEFDVVDTGRLELPDLTLTQVLQVRTKLTVQSAVGGTKTLRQVSFLFECFGEVARATSHIDEPNESFTQAAEVRRLGL